MTERPLAVHVDTESFPPATRSIERLRTAGIRFEWRPSRTPEELAAAVADADAVLSCGRRIDAAAIDAMPRARIVARYGAGLDLIDVDAAARAGIVVTSTPEYAVEEVAVHALALMLALERNLLFLDRAVRAGEWHRRRERGSRRLSTMTLGIVGLGRIGTALAERAAALGMRVVAPQRHDGREAPGDVQFVQFVPFHDLLRTVDVLSLHVPLTPRTRGLIGAPELALMRPSSLLVNTARGAVVDEAALADALDAGRLAGAGLDVFESEPPDPASRLLQSDRAIVTPHSASHSDAASRQQHDDAIDSVIDVLGGRWPRFAATADLRPRQPLR